MKEPHTEVWEKKTQCVEFPGHKMVEDAMDRHPAMLHQNHTARCLSCQNGTPKHLQTRWRHKGTGAPPPNRCRQPTPEPTPPLPRSAPCQTSNKWGAEHSKNLNLPAGYAYSHTSPHCAEFFTLDASAQDSQDDPEFDPDMLTDEGTSTG